MKPQNPYTEQGRVENSVAPANYDSGISKSDPTREIRWRIITTSELEQLRKSIHAMYLSIPGPFHPDETLLMGIIDEVEQRGR